MADIRETTIEHVSGTDTFTVYSSEQKWINRINKLKSEKPDDVEILNRDDGSILVHVPASWVKISPKVQRNLTDEQREALKATLAAGRQKHMENKRMTAEVVQ